MYVRDALIIKGVLKFCFRKPRLARDRVLAHVHDAGDLLTLQQRQEIIQAASLIADCIERRHPYSNALICPQLASTRAAGPSVNQSRMALMTSLRFCAPSMDSNGQAMKTLRQLEP